MLRIMSDHDVQGLVSHLMGTCQSPPWLGLWRELDCILCTFDDFNLPSNASDAAVWQTCQENGVVLITGNRNAEGPQSLEVTIRHHNRADALPVLTLADPDRIRRDAAYAQSTIERLFEVLVDVDNLRGTGRLFLP